MTFGGSSVEDSSLNCKPDKRQLRSLLDRDLIAGGLKISDSGKVCRETYARELNCSAARLERCEDVFAYFDHHVSSKECGPDTSAGDMRSWSLRLRELLDRDRAAGQLLQAKAGVTDRRHYERILGCPRGTLSQRRFKPVFDEFEGESKGEAGPNRSLSAMRDWLSERFERGELSLRSGKIDRAGFLRQFGFESGSYIVRYPAIASLLEEFDRRVAVDRYLPKADAVLLSRLNAVLDGDLVLNKTRLSIDVTWLANELQIPVGWFKSKAHLADVLLERQTRVEIEAKASVIDPFIHGRVFRFSQIANVWSLTFLSRLGGGFRLAISALAPDNAKPLYLSLLDFLKWMGSSDSAHCRTVVADAVRHGRISCAREWEDSLFEYRQVLVAKIDAGSKPSDVDSDISCLRSILSRLSDIGIVPASHFSLPGVRFSERLENRLRSVAEAPAAGLHANFAYVEFARTAYVQAAKQYLSGPPELEAELFIASLANEFAASPDLLADPATAILAMLDSRLKALQSAAVRLVHSARERLAEGERLLAIATIEPVEFQAAYLSAHQTSRQRRELTQRWFPNSSNAADHDVEIGKANFLRLLDVCFKGIAPIGVLPGWGAFFAKRYLSYGGVSHISSLLVPEADSAGAALVLYQIESGSNVSVGRTLDRDCVEDSDAPDHSRVTGHKARAKGRAIIVDLPDSSESIKALNWVRSNSRRLVEASSSDKDRLFLIYVAGRVQLMAPHWYTAWFKRFAEDIPALRGLGLTPNMIRPSVLLKLSLSNDGRLRTGMALAQHGEAVSQGYQQKWPTRLKYDHNIRRFQEAFETLVMSGVPEAAAKLQITEAQFESRLSSIRPTGLGTFCKDPRARPEETASCSRMECWNNCPHILIIAEVDAIASLQLWQKALRTARADWERDRIDRWESIWLPWLCLTDVVEEKMTRGSHLKTWVAAQKRAEAISARTDYVSPRPW